MPTDTPLPDKVSAADMARLTKFKADAETDSKKADALMAAREKAVAAHEEARQKADGSVAAYMGQSHIIHREYEIDPIKDNFDPETGAIERGVVSDEEQDRRRVMAQRGRDRGRAAQGPATHVG